jgi:hypothetical protein
MTTNLDKNPGYCGKKEANNRLYTANEKYSVKSRSFHLSMPINTLEPVLKLRLATVLITFHYIRDETAV